MSDHVTNGAPQITISTRGGIDAEQTVSTPASEIVTAIRCSDDTTTQSKVAVVGPSPDEIETRQIIMKRSLMTDHAAFIVSEEGPLSRSAADVVGDWCRYKLRRYGKGADLGRAVRKHFAELFRLERGLTSEQNGRDSDGAKAWLDEVVDEIDGSLTCLPFYQGNKKLLEFKASYLSSATGSGRCVLVTPAEFKKIFQGLCDGQK